MAVSKPDSRSDSVQSTWSADVLVDNRNLSITVTVIFVVYTGSYYLFISFYNKKIIICKVLALSNTTVWSMPFSSFFSYHQFLYLVFFSFTLTSQITVLFSGLLDFSFILVAYSLISMLRVNWQFFVSFRVQISIVLYHNATPDYTT